MKSIVSKNYKLLELTHLNYIEKYLQEVVNLSFEYSSTFLFNYTLDSFKQLPIHMFSLNLSTDNECLFKFLTLFNLYLEKDSFFMDICVYLNLKFKIKFNQFLQLICFRGNSAIKNCNSLLTSNLNYGLSFKDFILASFKTRDSIIDSSVNIFASGYLTRKLIESLRSLNIKEVKCTTKYTCYDSKLRTLINVPLLCGSSKSVCAFCLNMFYKYNSIIGYNKGTVSGQALGEPSTQMLLRTFHLGGDFSNFAGMTSSFFRNLTSNYEYSVPFSSLYFLGFTNTGKQNYTSKEYMVRKFDSYNGIINFNKNNLYKFVFLQKTYAHIWSLIGFKISNVMCNSYYRRKIYDKCVKHYGYNF